MKFMPFVKFFSVPPGLPLNLWAESKLVSKEHIEQFADLDEFISACCPLYLEFSPNLTEADLVY